MSLFVNSVSGISSENKSTLNIRTTMPDELLRHNISDEELTDLADTRRDSLWEGMWVALGSAIGFLPTTIMAFYQAYFKDVPIPISFIDLFQVILFFVSAAIFIVLCIVLRSKSQTATNLVTAIRNRTAN